MRLTSPLAAHWASLFLAALPLGGLPFSAWALSAAPLAGLPVSRLPRSGAAFSGRGRRKKVRRAIGKAVRRVRTQWSPSERRRRADAADEMQLRLLNLLGLRMTLIGVPNAPR